ncbi:MAG: hypothetical protein ACYCT2_08450 [Thermoplasmataceae archaeon]
MNDMDRAKEIDKMSELQRVLYNNFEDAVMHKEPTKASELIWGSVSNIAVGLGIMHKERVTGHKETVEYVRALIRTNYPDKDNLVNSLDKLHSNFYHGWMDQQTFDKFASDAVILRTLLLELWEKEKKNFIRTSAFAD